MTLDADTTVAALAALLAAYELWAGRVDANRRATLEHLRLVDERLQGLWSEDTKSIQDNILACYKAAKARRPGGAQTSAPVVLDEDDRSYLAFLNSLDLLALASESGVADKKMTRRYLAPLFQRHLVSQEFITSFQDCCGDSSIYEHLDRLYRKHVAAASLAAGA